MTTDRTERSGFSLLEVVVAAFVLTVAGAGAGVLAWQAGRANARVIREAVVLRDATVLADSLRAEVDAGSTGGAGRRGTAWGELRWSTAEGVVTAHPPDPAGDTVEWLRLRFPRR